MQLSARGLHLSLDATIKIPSALEQHFLHLLRPLTKKIASVIFSHFLMEPLLPSEFHGGVKELMSKKMEKSITREGYTLHKCLRSVFLPL